MKLYYNDNGERILLVDVMTNHSMSIDDVLSLAEFNVDDWAAAQGWDNWDFEALEMDYE